MLKATETKQLIKFIEQSEAAPLTLAQALQGTGLEPQHLEGQDCLVEVAQFVRLLENIANATNPVLFCLEFARWMTPAHFGLMGFTIMSCSEPRELVESWRQYSTELLGNGLKTTTEIRDEVLVASYSEAVPLGDAKRSAVLIAAACAKTLCEFLYGHAYILRVFFEFSEPESSSAIAEFFGVEVTYNAGRNSVEYDASVLNRPVLTSTPSLYEVFRQLCERESAKLRQSKGTAGSVVEILEKSPTAELPTLEEVAEKLCISPRTVRRRLSAEGKNFQALLTDFRTESAKSQLSNGVSIGEVSYNLGFLDVNSFRRAFKQWTGVTAGDFIKQQGIDAR
ncbi:MAG: AraC family transcriptional regulator ligand-binding domain-containing protein [bacterium]